MNFSKSRKHLPSLLLEMHKISELLAQAQVGFAPRMRACPMVMVMMMMMCVAKAGQQPGRQGFMLVEAPQSLFRLRLSCQVPGGTSQFFRSLSLDAEGSETDENAPAAASSTKRGGVPAAAQSPALSSRGSSVENIPDQKHALENQEWAIFLQVVEAGIRAIRQHPETVPE